MSLRILQQALTFDDILLVPAYSTVLPKEVTVQTKFTKKISLNIPLVSAAMDTVTEARLAISLAQAGGIGIIHKNMSIADQAEQVCKVKKFESGLVKDPICVNPDIKIAELIKLIEKYNISGMPVIDNNQLVGIVTSRDIRFETNFDLPVSAVMTTKDRLITVKEGASREEIQSLLHKHRIEKLLVINDAFNLCGLITVKDMQKSQENPFASKNDFAQLLVGAAVGVGENTEQRIEALIEAGVDVLVVDTAHGHSQRVLDKVQWIKKNYINMQVIGGNIGTASAAAALIAAGADAVKVGIGPGSICTTRIITGVGVPQVTAIANVAAGVKDEVPIIADGGIRFSGDVCKALAVGANVVMIGSLFAGTEESPGEIELYQGSTYKNYRGMGSLGAMSQGSSDRYFQENSSSEKLVPEGIEGRVPYKGPIQTIIHQIIGGLRSCMGYTGCESIDLLRKNVEFLQITHASMRESHVHGVSVTKQAPNYQVNELNNR